MIVHFQFANANDRYKPSRHCTKNKGFFSKCDQIRRKPRIWSHLLKTSLMENFIFCAVKQIRFKYSMLQSDLCDYSDAYVVVKRTITVIGENNSDRKNSSLAFENNAQFISCISKINNVLIENAEDLHVVKPMYNLIE